MCFSGAVSNAASCGCVSTTTYQQHFILARLIGPATERADHRLVFGHSSLTLVAASCFCSNSGAVRRCGGRGLSLSVKQAALSMLENGGLLGSHTTSIHRQQSGRRIHRYHARLCNVCVEKPTKTKGACQSRAGTVQ